MARAEHLFIVHIWQDGSTATSPWRGSVEHVPQGQRLYFTSLTDLSGFIAARLDNALPPSPPGNRKPADRPPLGRVVTDPDASKAGWRLTLPITPNPFGKEAKQ